MKFLQNSPQAFLNVKCWLQFLINFKLSIKSAERKRRAEDPTQMQEIEITGNRKVPPSFQSYLPNKTSLVKYVFQKQRETLSKVLTSSQTIYITNLYGGTDRVTSQAKVMKELIFIVTTKKLTQKCFSYIKFLCDNIRLIRYLYMKVPFTLHSQTQYGSKLVPKTIRDIYTYTSISFRIRITNMLLASCNTCNVRM